MHHTDFFANHFGLSERPFTLLPDPDFLFWSASHKRAYAVLEYGIVTCAPITVITGEVGAGKTTLLQQLLHDINDSATTIGLISNAQGNRGELLQWALNALALDCEGTDYVTKFQRLQDFLIDEYSRGRRVVLIIDEAQNLSVEGLEELRMLTNINANKDELLQLILIGQPELRDMISRPELRQFAQRVTASYHIPALDREATGLYIAHRLRHAGGTGHEFSPQAVDLVHGYSGGVPRLINKLCDFAMVYAATADTTVVDQAIVQEVLDDSIFVNTVDPSPPEEKG